MPVQKETAAQGGVSPERLEVRAYLEAAAARSGCTVEAYIARYDQRDPQYAQELRRLAGVSGASSE